MIKISPLFLSIAILFATVPATAFAQPEIGSRIDRSREGMTGFHDPMVQQSARAGINAIGRCKAENNRFRALKTLDHKYLSTEQAKSLNYIYKKVDYDDPCYIAKNIRFGFSTAPAVGSFSEFFLLRKYGEDDIASLASLTNLEWQQDMMKPRNAEELFGLCVVQSGREKIYALINTVPDTEAEGEAISAIMPLLGPCIRDGAEIAFDKTSLRAMLAFGLYRAVRQHAEMLEAAE
ncbi:hypothetical protein [Parasphingorhabdus flavimaris]|uniref:Uncharacterized protein n=1 Tax=Parasphingorhabdus flavimaris TaxID=266812 RepID=A0ABX2N1C5_9SPHN|nr:hypothetical protein [Parasphingorhabdus flavimaris]NVD27515.1 hypothetical protein [Parasphingorhabdus flavimaris]